MGRLRQDTFPTTALAVFAMPSPDLEALRKQLHEAIDLAISGYENTQNSQLIFEKAPPKLPYHTIPQIRDLIKTSISCLVDEIKAPEFTLTTIAYELSKHAIFLEGDSETKWNNQISGAIRQWDPAVNGPRLILPVYNKKNRYAFAGTVLSNYFAIETVAEADSRMSDQGMTLGSWIAKSLIGKTTAYKLLAALDIEPLKARIPESRKPVSWLSKEMLNALDPAVKRFHEGCTVASSVKID